MRSRKMYAFELGGTAYIDTDILRSALEHTSKGNKIKIEDLPATHIHVTDLLNYAPARLHPLSRRNRIWRKALKDVATVQANMGAPKKCNFKVTLLVLKDVENNVFAISWIKRGRLTLLRYQHEVLYWRKLGYEVVSTTKLDCNSSLASKIFHDIASTMKITDGVYREEFNVASFVCERGTKLGDIDYQMARSIRSIIGAY